MATLRSLSRDYMETAAQLNISVKRAQKALAECDERERGKRACDLKLLCQMRLQMREVGRLAKHYYDRGYYRDKRYTF